ncbi:pyruvate dehydrogenase complex dihydrolipoamide acetyltransferase [Paracoccus benzoatiresistens]|uniref:Acetyltransferase component of pyruvate dehydrogenase complex n=1 Tax=Paracoccus benzoatiresistens TaxID=2997341 RepID=A0ABT4JB01_9RHOB|nr:pyruvate dehydrogenase complex dihydrolipoamide acetyltransferase [Paracoccus sp. EF6]MCZ0963656.1 pyruvate dehydrogenase complex dihydrolipoamide acetyltransferase [Paracoccus sp. EF6]
MAIDITLPSLSAGMEDAVIAKWLIAAGDPISKGQAIAEVETDKATMELEAEADGILGRIDIADGQRADVGQVIAVVLADGETLPPVGASAPAPAATPRTLTEGPVSTATAAAPSTTGRKHAASPLARRLADEAGLDLQGITGSGPRGRIVKLDVQRLLAATPAPVAAPAPAVQPQPQAVPPGIGPHEAQPLSNMRRTIARRLVEAKTSIPHFYLSVDCELDALLALRAEVNKGRDKAERISINDFVIKAAARALRKVPAANVVWNGDEILQLADIDISVAVATDGGLITPILRGADRMSLGTLSAEMKALAARAHQGKLRPEEYQGGGFSVSNLGMYGVQTFSAIINPPQSCILAVGTSLRRPVGRGDQIVLADVMSVTLSVDHRSVDGALGAQVLAAFKDSIENPMSLLV